MLHINDFGTIKMSYVNYSVVSIVNLAVNQETSASSVWEYQICPVWCCSERALNGDRNTDIIKCFETNKKGKPWWAVRLASNEVIAPVVVANKVVGKQNVSCSWDIHYHVGSVTMVAAYYHFYYSCC